MKRYVLNSLAVLCALLAGSGVLLVGCGSDKSQIEGIEQQLSSINRKLDVLEERLSQGEQPLLVNADEANPASDELVSALVAADDKEKATILEEQLLRASNFTSIEIDTMEDLVDSMESLNTILSEVDLDAEMTNKLQAEQSRLVSVLEKGIPDAVRTLIGKALAAKDYRSAQDLWSDAGLLVEYFPSTNDPAADRAFDKLVAEHEETAARLQLRQEQRYNKWACSQIKAADEIISSQSPEESVRTCIKYVGPINPGMLEPLSLDIYSEFLASVRKKLPLATFYELAELLSVVERTPLSDIPADS